jgi:hypothetical protein
MAMSALSLATTGAGGALFLRRFPCSRPATPSPHHFRLLVEDSAAAHANQW